MYVVSPADVNYVVLFARPADRPRNSLPRLWPVFSQPATQIVVRLARSEVRLWLARDPSFPGARRSGPRRRPGCRPAPPAGTGSPDGLARAALRSGPRRRPGCRPAPPAGTGSLGSGAAGLGPPAGAVRGGGVSSRAVRWDRQQPGPGRPEPSLRCHCAAGLRETST